MCNCFCLTYVVVGFLVGALCVCVRVGVYCVVVFCVVCVVMLVMLINVFFGECFD
jgi:hypothetical protein